LGTGWRTLFVAVGDTAPFEVIWRELDLDLVAGQDADVVHAHLAGYVGEQFVPVVEFNTEHGIWQAFYNRAFHEYCVFFSSDGADFPF